MIDLSQYNITNQTVNKVSMASIMNEYDEYDEGYETDDTEIAEDFKYEPMRYGEMSVVIRGYHYAERETIFENNKYIIDNQDVTIIYIDNDNNEITYVNDYDEARDTVSTKEFVDMILDGTAIISYSLWDAYYNR